MPKCEYHDKIQTDFHDLEIDINRVKNEVSMRLDHHGAGIKNCEDGVMELKGLLIGTPQKKGILHEVSDMCKLFKTHIDESDLYRPMILNSDKVCKQISESIGMTWRSVLKTIGAMIPYGMCAWLLWLISNMK